VDATNVQPESRKPIVEIGRKLVFVGDLVDRGPKIPQVFKLVRNAVTSGAALCVPVNTT
jgi:protein phosphatase